MTARIKSERNVQSWTAQWEKTCSHRLHLQWEWEWDIIPRPSGAKMRIAAGSLGILFFRPPLGIMLDSRLPGD